MSTDGNSYLEGLWDSTTGALCSVIDAYGWIIPALLLTALLLCAILLVAWFLEDIPIEPSIPLGIRSIFKWARKTLGPTQAQSPE